MVTWSNDVIVSLFALVLQLPCCLSFSTRNFFYTSAMSSSGGWPRGPFTLLQPTTGCPMTGRWEAGSIHQDTEDTFGGNHFSTDIDRYLEGKFAENNIDTHYCSKRESYGPDWPTGSYCIMRHNGYCPPGFQEGFVFWDDEDDGNANGAYGTLPDEVYASYYYYPTLQDIKIHYCCRDDGRPEQPISLPTDHPFVLVRNGLQCQQVANMELQEVFIRWDDEDISNQDAVGGAHPYDDGGEHDHLLYFCHYQMGVNSTVPGPVVG